ncbi:AMP-binding enzyme [Kribbella yunnanensis]|uniref:SagB/ThcOx family dehydrogenase n=1 Tax=Kribbella yunnanensis TaxID=190194 RepID=UPI003CD07C8F
MKINGFRVELDEVELQLRAHPSVARAAVVKTESNQLLAAVTPADSSCTAEDLRSHLAELLPTYLVPSRFLVLDTLPITTNGKLDYASLKKETARTARSAAPDDDRSRHFLEDIADILGLEQVDTSKSLIAMGAASIEIVRLSNRVRGYAQDRLGLQDYFAAPSIDALLLALADDPHTSDLAPPRQRGAAGGLATGRTSIELSVKQAHVGLRKDLGEAPAVRLLRESDADPSLRRRLRSRRCYSLDPIGFRTLSRWLATLAALGPEGGPSYRYGSAGSLYAVQVYLHVKPGRVSGLLGGDYYYHPGQQSLVELGPGSRVNRDVYGDENRLIYDQAGLVVFLVCSLDAVEASYGEWGYDLALFEAGSMGQLLREAAAQLGLGVCSIGTLDFSRVRPGFGIDERHLLLHSLTCGAVDEGNLDLDGENRVGREAAELDRAVSLLRRVDALDEPHARELEACIAGDGLDEA